MLSVRWEETGDSPEKGDEGDDGEQDACDDDDDFSLCVDVAEVDVVDYFLRDDFCGDSDAVRTVLAV